MLQLYSWFVCLCVIVFFNAFEGIPGDQCLGFQLLSVCKKETPRYADRLPLTAKSTLSWLRSVTKCIIIRFLFCRDDHRMFRCNMPWFWSYKAEKVTYQVSLSVQRNCITWFFEWHSSTRSFFLFFFYILTQNLLIISKSNISM